MCVGGVYPLTFELADDVSTLVCMDAIMIWLAVRKRIGVGWESRHYFKTSNIYENHLFAPMSWKSCFQLVAILYMIVISNARVFFN